MDKSLILARTANGMLWQAMHKSGSPTWTWLRASESATDIMGHLVLTVDRLPVNAGQITAAMLPGVAGEGVTRP